MKVEALDAAPSPLLTAALAEFETQFTYPLGPGRSFSISHGVDYSRFFRAMGDARCFIAMRGDRVLGTLGVSLRRITQPDGSSRRAAYFGDLKIGKTDRGAMVLGQLARAADAWARPQPQVTAAFGVVMDGTSLLPTTYTGRAGLPMFERIASVVVRRLPSSETAIDNCQVLSPVDGRERFEVLCKGSVFAADGEPAERSEIGPTWISSRDGQAIGRLEDTRRAKRLIADDGVEMRSAHLACFAWRTPDAARAVLEGARRRAAGLNLPALFFASPKTDEPELSPVVQTLEDLPSEAVTMAGATVYGVALPAGERWIVSTSEI